MVGSQASGVIVIWCWTKNMKIYTWFINNLFLYTLGATINFIYTYLYLLYLLWEKHIIYASLSLVCLF